MDIVFTLLWLGLTAWFLSAVTNMTIRYYPYIQQFIKDPFLNIIAMQVAGYVLGVILVGNVWLRVATPLFG